MQFKDTAGNTLRETSSGWEILQKGVGWREFVGMTVLDDGRVINTRQLVDETAIEVTDSSAHKKQLEDDLFRHYAGIALSKADVYEPFEQLARGCCGVAEAMIDELKKRGRL